MNNIKKVLSHKFSPILSFSLSMMEILLVTALLVFSLIIVTGWGAEPATGKPTFDSPLPSPTPGIVLVKETPTPGPDPVLNLTFTHEPIYLSLSNGGAYTVGTVANVSNEDILRFEGTDFVMVFDGSDVGLSSTDLDALTLVDADTILMSFNDPITLSLGVVDDSDILQFDATSLGETTTGSFSWFFDGSDVDLTLDGEDVDGIDLLPDGQLLLSTTGGVSVSGLSAEDEDALIFTPTAYGENTSGSWAIYFDGSDVGLADTADEDVDGLGVSTSGSIYLTTLGSFAVTGISGEDEGVFVCIPANLGNDTACTFSSALSFDGALWGLSINDVDAIETLP